MAELSGPSHLLTFCVVMNRVVVPYNACNENTVDNDAVVSTSLKVASACNTFLHSTFHQRDTHLACIHKL